MKNKLKLLDIYLRLGCVSSMRWEKWRVTGLLRETSIRDWWLWQCLLPFPCVFGWPEWVKAWKLGSYGHHSHAISVHPPGVEEGRGRAMLDHWGRSMLPHRPGSLRGEEVSLPHWKGGYFWELPYVKGCFRAKLYQEYRHTVHRATDPQAEGQLRGPHLLIIPSGYSGNWSFPTFHLKTIRIETIVSGKLTSDILSVADW